MGFDRDWELGFWGHFWGKLGSFGVNLGPLEICSHSTLNPMPFWAEIRHLCYNPKRIRGNPLYGVSLGYVTYKHLRDNETSGTIS